MFVQLLANGIIYGSIIALVAVGFSLIFSTNRFVHFAHGSVIVCGGFFLHTFYSLAGLNFYLSAVLTIIATALLGLVIYLLVYYPLRRRQASAVILLIASLGVMILLDNLNLLIFGADVKVLNFIEVKKGLDILGAIITPLQLVIITVSLILLVLVSLFTRYTALGKTIRAVADNPTLAEILGISTRKIEAISFLVGSALAGFASVMFTLEYGVEFSMGIVHTIAGFTGAVIGGINSLAGSILGSYLLGLVQNLGIWFLPSGFKMAIAFILLLLFLLIKPNGIFGIEKGAREQKI
ncbi:MAG: branched-chain amino acid ABC transporter permease [Candidatus Magasanikbacteria bacterium CG10_big_fil_rev_8_21_14_0_10_40_10]|uniref:Branched-chain amino acid ABC transporter permease n=1 Tax=Candidatus Magasanikbacteria bacterium CG10_big_fil_rev_8_21_14_0_10_40_10 TaxID=1974648 RepID=A0A2M6W368_9BACT|nr:MAG: branched-chain amino acid ABC transporter permease [Candidatus Magasanikbacteria bacterium CG10_big_fil_rev_8_21_14_0_10_40_10]